MAVLEQGREKLASRIGFLLVSAGCAIGLGNVWRFPYIAGRHGGAIFLGTYLLTLLLVGLPVLIMEFSIGRAARKNMGLALRELEPKGSRWHCIGWFSLVGSYCLMMFYTPITGWLFSYCYHTLKGSMSGLNPEQVEAFFGTMLSQPLPMYGWTVLGIALGLLVCVLGVRNGVERVVKILMLGLLAIMIILAAKSLTLPGAKEGMDFYLLPDWQRAKDAGLWKLVDDAMNHAFFTLSVGIGSMMIFGSYVSKNRTLTGEAAWIVGLDTFVALMAGVIIFPACFSFGVEPNTGPALLFITLPNIFNEMAGGFFWGSLFFMFMLCAALTTVIAVFENIISYCCDVWGWSRKKSVIINGFALLTLCLPCILGFNLWSGFMPLGSNSSVLDLEDFIVSNNLLPLGSLVFVLFCTSRYGWGFDNFVTETDQGKGLRFPRWARFYLTWILPVFILLVFVQGYINIIFK